MMKQMGKWLLGLFVVALVLVEIVFIAVMNPSLFYTYRSTYHRFIIYHHQTLDPSFTQHLDRAEQMASTSELYNPRLALSICLNDGSAYTALIEKIRGRGFGWGFLNKIALGGAVHYKENYVEYQGHRWNLTQLLAHEIIHCYQFEKLGLWKSNPIGAIPAWKWEGYPEYMSRQNPDQKDIIRNIHRFIKSEQLGDTARIHFADSTSASVTYYKRWLLMQYSLDVRQMTYAQVLRDTIEEGYVEQHMFEWYCSR